MKFLRQCGFILILLALAACQISQGDAHSNMSDISEHETAVMHDADIDEYLTILSFDENLAALAQRSEDIDTPWARSFVEAYEDVQAGENDAAIAILQEIADDESNEIGLRFWAWNGLRELGVSPDDNTVYAYIFEVNLGEHEADILAVYNDGRLRFISGQVGLQGIFVWENYDSSHSLNQKAIESLELTQALLAEAQPIAEHSHTIPSEDAPRLTLMTFNGLYRLEIARDDYSGAMLEFWQAASETVLEIVQTRTEYNQTETAP